MKRTATSGSDYREIVEDAPEFEASIYGDALPGMQDALNQVINKISTFRKAIAEERGGDDPIEHCLFRIKSDESMREKCRRKGLPETSESALRVIRDAIGIRIVCAFVNDVYKIKDYLLSIPDYELVCEKDYIRHAKSNGYRSYHIILKVDGYFVEVQLRTISMDTWAALEHQMRYKKGGRADNTLIVSKLKRCADELASTDVSMQTIRDMIFEEGVFRRDSDT